MRGPMMHRTDCTTERKKDSIILSSSVVPIRTSVVCIYPRSTVRLRRRASHLTIIHQTVPKSSNTNLILIYLLVPPNYLGIQIPGKS